MSLDRDETRRERLAELREAVRVNEEVRSKAVGAVEWYDRIVERHEREIRWHQWKIEEAGKARDVAPRMIAQCDTLLRAQREAIAALEREIAEERKPMRVKREEAVAALIKRIEAGDVTAIEELRRLV